MKKIKIPVGDILSSTARPSDSETKTSFMQYVPMEFDDQRPGIFDMEEHVKRLRENGVEEPVIRETIFLIIQTLIDMTVKVTAEPLMKEFHRIFDKDDE